MDVDVKREASDTEEIRSFVSVSLQNTIPCGSASSSNLAAASDQPLVLFKRFFADAKLPTRALANSAGLTIFTSKEIDIFKDGVIPINTGLGFQPQKNYYGFIASLHTVAMRGLLILGNVIESDYRGVIKILATNVSTTPIHLKKNEGFALLILQKYTSPRVLEVNTLEPAEEIDSSDSPDI